MYTVCFEIYTKDFKSLEEGIYFNCDDYLYTNISDANKACEARANKVLEIMDSQGFKLKNRYFSDLGQDKYWYEFEFEGISRRLHIYVHKFFDKEIEN